MDDWENGRIDEGALLNMLNMVEDLASKRVQSGEDTDLSSLGMDINKMLFSARLYDEKRSVG